MYSASRHLAFHASLVLSFGVLLGAPYGRAINRGAPAQIVNSWRVAHQSLSLAAGLMFAIAAVLPLLTAPMAAIWFVVVTLVASNYAFCISMPLAAMTGHRGLSPDGKGLQRLVFHANLAGAFLALAACAGLVFVCAASLLDAEP
jgi:hypothetical protein